MHLDGCSGEVKRVRDLLVAEAGVTQLGGCSLAVARFRNRSPLQGWLAARKPIVVVGCDLLGLLLRHRPWASMQVHRVDDRPIGEPDPIAVEGVLVRGPGGLDELGG